jgi:hypothetical protein
MARLNKSLETVSSPAGKAASARTWRAAGRAGHTTQCSCVPKPEVFRLPGPRANVSITEKLGHMGTWSGGGNRKGAKAALVAAFLKRST